MYLENLDTLNNLKFITKCDLRCNRDLKCTAAHVMQTSVSQLLGPGINYTGPREVLLEFVILVF